MPVLIAALLLLIFATLAFAFVAYLLAYPALVIACVAVWLLWRTVLRPALKAAVLRKLPPSGYVWGDTGESWQGETYAQRRRKPMAAITVPRRAARIPPQLLGCSNDDGGE